MVSLIVCDLDGTILPKNAKNLQQNIIGTLEKLSQKGILICIATGRSYVQVKRMFEHVSFTPYFICSDGGITIYKEETLEKFPISVDASSYPTAIGYGKYVAYASCGNKPFYRQAKTDYHGHVLPLCECKDEIYKLAVKNAPLKEIPGLTRIYKDATWQEYIDQNTNKGVALSALQKRLNIQKENTVIFGDSSNDIPMTPFGKSYLIGNGFCGWQNHFEKSYPDFITAIKEVIR
ncbi:MAG: HAD family phosphatase [Clostridia bacterium]|nr:HAD family phosphatase [Clostridia bacterium]